MTPLVLSACGMGTVLLVSVPQDYLLAYLLLLPLFGAFFCSLLPSTALFQIRQLCLTICFLTLLIALRLWAAYVPLAPEPFQQVVGFTAGWNGLISIRLEFGLDGLSLWMVLLTAALMPLCILCSWTSQTAHSQSFNILLLVLETALLAAFTCLDLLGFYVLYESALLPMFLLIGLGGSRPRKVKAAYLLVLYTLVGSLAMLPCLLIMYSQVGSSRFELLSMHNWDPSIQLILWWGLFLAFAVKVPMMPVHLWLPEAHVEASTAGSVLLAGVLLKLGTYGLLRFRLPLLPYATVYYGPFVITLSLIGIVYASLTTLRQVDLKKIVAYSSVAHMNMVVLALFTGNSLGAGAATFLMLAHGVASPALFLLVGSLYDRTHTKALKYLGGAAVAMPLFSALFFVFSLANMALPLSPNFVGEFLCLCGIFMHNLWALYGALIGVLFSAAYTMWAYARVVHGLPKPQYFSSMADLCRREFWAFVPLLFLTVWWGVKPFVVLDSIYASLSFWHNASLLSIAKMDSSVISRKDNISWVLDTLQRIQLS